MIKEYRYNHRIYHEKDMKRMDRIIVLMEEINRKTKKEFLYNKQLNEFHSSCIIDNEFKEIEVENLIKRISNV